jgi:hypothetical protein
MVLALARRTFSSSLKSLGTTKGRLCALSTELSSGLLWFFIVVVGTWTSVQTHEYVLLVQREPRVDYPTTVVEVSQRLFSLNQQALNRGHALADLKKGKHDNVVSSLGCQANHLWLLT